MEFRVLGPMEVRADGRAIEIRGSKRRAVLAVLVLHANEVVRTERLIDEVWGERPPANASAALHNHVSRLRKDLGTDVVVTKAWGYVLRADPEEIDAKRFERLVADARPLPARDRAARLRNALELWRGSAFADLADEPALTVEIARLDELRVAALEQRINADLELGLHEELIPELERLVAEHPLRESLRGQLILALYRSGRQAEALETYRETRRVLVDELGIEPSAELRELERAILRQDPALVAAAPAPATVTTDPRVRRWRWPRSPLAVAVVGLAIGVAGAAAAFAVTRHDAADRRVAALTHAATTRARARRATVRVLTTSRTTVVRTTAKSARAAHPAVQARAAKRPTTVKTAAKHQATSAKPPAKRAAPKRTHRTVPTPQPFLIVDNFADPTFEPTVWHRATLGTGWDFLERNGRLEIGLSADSVLAESGIDAHYGTQCRVTGDFDARVEFSLLAWPPASGAMAGLGVYFNQTDGNIYVSRASANAYDFYGWGYPAYGLGASIDTADTVGTLRLVRRRDLVTASYRHAGRWVRMGSAAASGAANVVVQVSAGSNFSHSAVRAAFDNFRTVADGVDCPPGIPTPPRKSR